MALSESETVLHEGVRRRRHHAAPVSGRRAAYDGACVALLLAPSLLGIFLFGAVRLWSVGPLMFLAFCGVALFFLRPFFSAELRQLQVPPGGLAGLALLAYVLLTVPRAEVPYEARIEGLKLASYVGAYWAWSELASRHRRWRFLLGALVVTVTLIAWYAVIQHARGSRMVLNLVRPESYGMRASGTYFCPNHFAHLLELVMPFSLALLLMGSARAPLRLLAGYSLLLFLPVMFLTQSRSGWIGTAAGLGVTACLGAARKGRRPFVVAVIAVPLAVAAAGGLLWAFSEVFRARVEDALAGNVRIQLWQDTLRMIRERPWLGYGGGSYQWVFPQFRSLSSQMLYNYAHNEYLHAVADYGLAGLALWAVFLGTAVVRLLKAWSAVERDRDFWLIAALMGSLAASLAHALFDFNLHIFSNNHVLVLLAGTVAACLYSTGHFQPRRLGAPAFRVVYGGAALAAAVLAALALQATASYALTLRADALRARFEMPRALALYRVARAADPGNWRAFQGAANVQQALSFWNRDPEAREAQAREAQAWYETAKRLNPYDLETLFGLSKIQNTRGQPEQALESLRQAAQHDRNHMFYVTQFGIQLRRMGRDEEALRFFREVQKTWDTELVRLNIQALETRLTRRAVVQPPASP